jgi:hypothetical protein
MRRSFSLIAGATLALAAGASPAGAAAITPGETPLWLSTTDPAITCPSAGAASGEGAIEAVRSTKGNDARSLLILTTMLADAVAPAPIVGACDRPAAAARRFLGPITGSSGQGVNDIAYFGQRGLIGTDGDDGAALRPGDELVMPGGTTDASLDLRVAAGDASSVVRVSDGGPLPTRLQITGTIAAPSISVTAAEGAQRTIAISPPASAKQTIRLRRDRRKLRATFTAAPGTLLVLASPTDAASRIASTRAVTLAIKVPRRRTDDVIVAAYDPRTRALTHRACGLTKARRFACGATLHGLGSFAQTAFADPEIDRSAAEPLTPLARAASARSAPKARFIPASVTRIATDRHNRDELSPLVGDVNGDGRPDGWVTTSGGSDGDLLVSSAPGGWTRVHVKGVQLGPFADAPAVQDLTGDGRADLVAGGGVLVTDALSGSGLPRSINLSGSTVAGRLDLVHPNVGPFEDAGSGPQAGLPDITGDGRPELVVGNGPLTIYPSSAYPLGRAATHAGVRPLRPVEPGADLDAALTAFLGGDPFDGHFAPQRSASYLVSGGRLFTVDPVDRSKVSRTSSQPITLSERRADGSVIAARRFTAAGWPKLLDVDPVTGDALVHLVRPGSCPKRPVYPGAPFRERICRERLVRIAADGTLLAAVTFAIAQDDPVYAVFSNDGADADSRPEALIAFGGGMNPGPLHVLSSAAAGNQALDGLPLLDLGGKRRDDDIRSLTAVTSASGTRQTLAVTSPVSTPDENPSGELIIVAVR